MSKKSYIKHLIECQCILSIFKNKTKPLYHKFQVFSLIDDDIIAEKYVICNNCDIVHKVKEACKSEIMWGKENIKSLVTTIEDIRFNFDAMGFEDLSNILTKFNSDIFDWELADFLIENKESGTILLEKEEIDNNIVYKFLEFNNNKYKIKKEIHQRYV
jgi:hypothetical protein